MRDRYKIEDVAEKVFDATVKVTKNLNKVTESIDSAIEALRDKTAELQYFYDRVMYKKNLYRVIHRGLDYVAIVYKGRCLYVHCDDVKDLARDSRKRYKKAA